MVAQASELSPRATADVLWSCATLQDFPPQLLMPVLTSVAGHLDKEAFAPRHLALVVWSLARLTTKPTRLLERIEEQAIPRLDGMNDQNIANLLWGFAKLNYKPSKLLPRRRRRCRSRAWSRGQSTSRCPIWRLRLASWARRVIMTR